MQQFTPRPNSFGEIRKKIIVMMSIIFGGIIFIVMVVPYLLSDKSLTHGPTTWPYAIVLLVAIMGYSLFKGLKRQQANFESYILKITDEALVRELQPDILALKRLPLRGLLVTAASNQAPADFVSRYFAPAAGIDEWIAGRI